MKKLTKQDALLKPASSIGERLKAAIITSGVVKQERARGEALVTECYTQNRQSLYTQQAN